MGLLPDLYVGNLAAPPVVAGLSRWEVCLLPMYGYRGPHRGHGSPAFPSPLIYGYSGFSHRRGVV